MAEGSQKPGVDVYRDFSEFYEIYVGDFADDIPMYQEYAAGLDTPVLEIGAGSGRLTIPLASEGHEVIAVDISTSMLTLLRGRLGSLPDQVSGRIQIVQADVCQLNLSQTFDLVIVPYYTFNYLLTPDDQAEALERIKAHMADSALLIMDVFLPPATRIRNRTEGPLLRVDTVDPNTGNRIRGWSTFRLDPDTQIEQRHQRMEITQPDGRIDTREFVITRRYFFPDELEAMVTTHGYTVQKVFTGYQGEPPRANSDQLVYVLGL